MKKSVRIISLVLALVMVACVLASCGKTLSGTYSCEVLGQKVSYTFSGSKVTTTTTTNILGNTNSSETKGTYEIKEATDGTLSIVFTFKVNDNTSTTSYSFSENKDAKTITIGGVTYTKK